MVYQVLACGSNGQFQLGLGHDEDTCALKPVSFQFDQKTTLVPHRIVKIACGGNHTLILLENGQVYSSGDNKQGQCGRPDGGNSKLFAEVPQIDGKWVDISCGWDFSVLLSSNVYVCGSGPKGELGLGSGVKQTVLSRIKWEFGSIESIKSSLGHTIALLKDGSFVGWGNCRKGQLGSIPSLPTGKPAVAIWAPQKLVLDHGLFGKYDLGREFTVFHDSSTYCAYGKVAHDSWRVNDKDESIVEVHSMWSSNHILLQKSGFRYIKSVGNNSHGQHFPVPGPCQFKRFTTGSEHGIAETEDGSVFAWGWGEHGNCGSQTKRDPTDVVYNYLSPLYNSDHTVDLIAGGCATTWVVVEL